MQYPVSNAKQLSITETCAKTTRTQFTSCILFKIFNMIVNMITYVDTTYLSTNRENARFFSVFQLPIHVQY